MGMLLLMLALNFGVSWFNCWAVGRVWKDARALGGWPRILTWCGAIQAAIGFSSVIGFVIGITLHSMGKLPPAVAQGAMSMWYLLIIVPALSTGLVILVESWRAAYRDRSLANLGTAAYNTLAMAHNAYGAVDGIGKALAGVGELFEGKDEESGKMGVMAVALALAALAGGILLAAHLINRYSSTAALPLPARA